MNTPRIVIVGGGIAGMLLATELGRALGRPGRARISLVDRSFTHVWKPMLHTIAAGTQDVQQQQVSFIGHARTHGFVYEPGEMCGLDRDARFTQLVDHRVEVARAGVTANSLALGMMTTGDAGIDAGLARSVPVGRLGTPADIGAACVWLAPDEAAWVTGQTIEVNGGAITT